MRCLVLHPVLDANSHRDPQDALQEAVDLAQALDLEIVLAETVSLSKVRAGSLFGTGKVEEIGKAIADQDIGLAIIDGILSPVQQRNLERDWSCKVLDRTGLILEIFGARARTREGVLQVELAHLTYQKSRLVRSWTHLERQRGGVGFLGGPGETQIEADRRALDERIQRIKSALQKVVQTRGQHRKARQRVPFPIVALVGYTNAGKSTLLNRLTGSKVLARDMLFATLDPTMRGMTLPSGRDIILSDTVGFISDLPTHLIAAFRATLEEVLEADLILHVRDVSHRETEHQATNVRAILDNLGVDDTRDDILEIWNKSDLLEDEQRATAEAIATRREDVLLTSAKTGAGIDALFSQIERVLSANTTDERLTLSFDDGRRRAWLFERNLVREENITKTGIELAVSWSDSDRNRFFDLE